MENFETTIWSIALTLSALFYGVYTSYYFSIVVPIIEDLEEIRNEKIKNRIIANMKNNKTNSVDLFHILKDLNSNNKVWLLETSKDNQSRIALILLGCTTSALIFFFLLRKMILSPSNITNFSFIDLVFVGIYFFSLSWAIFTMYWEYIYYKPFFHNRNLIGKKINDNFEVVKKNE